MFFFSNAVSQRLKKKKNAEWHHCVLKSRWILIPRHIQGELLAFEVYKKNPNYDLTANDEFSKTRNLNDVAVFKRWHFLAKLIFFSRLCTPSQFFFLFTWFSNRPESRTRRTSKTQDLSRHTWSSWWRHLKPGISLAKVQTCRTWSMNRSEKWARKESSGRPFIGQVWKW